ncbi:MAG: hypothetical protein U1G07_07520 [Verrucomicrobiota bacterium]
MTPAKTITDIRHFLTERGQVPEALPPRARNLLDFVGGIVRSVSRSRQLFSSSPIYCRRRVGGRCCRGTISAYCENKDPAGPIHWICPDCRRRGEIHHWQGSVFDEVELRRLAELEYARQGVWINGYRLDELQLPAGPCGKPPTSYLLFPSQRTSARVGHSGQLRLRLPALLCVELFHRSILRQSEVTEIKIGVTPTLHFRFSGLRYPDNHDPVVELEFSADHAGDDLRR